MIITDTYCSTKSDISPFPFRPQLFGSDYPADLCIEAPHLQTLSTPRLFYIESQMFCLTRKAVSERWPVFFFIVFFSFQLLWHCDNSRASGRCIVAPDVFADISACLVSRGRANRGRGRDRLIQMITSEGKALNISFRPLFGVFAHSGSRTWRLLRVGPLHQPGDGGRTCPV